MEFKYNAFTDVCIGLFVLILLALSLPFLLILVIEDKIEKLWRKDD